MRAPRAQRAGNAVACTPPWRSCTAPGCCCSTNRRISGVDIATRSRLLAAISHLASEDGCAVVYSTHYLPEVEELGASVAILDHGRILARGALDDLVAAALGIMQVALGFMLLSVCRSVIQLNAITNAGAMLLGGLGGAVAPVELLPGWAQAVAPAMPTYWVMRGFRAVTMGPGGLVDVALPIGVLLAFALVFVVIAVNRFEVEATKVSWA